MLLDYETRFMELLWYALHLNMEKLELNKFMFDLNSNFCVRVRIYMPWTLHDVI